MDWHPTGELVLIARAEEAAGKSLHLLSKKLMIWSMRISFWLLLLIAGYIWMATTGNEQLVLNVGRTAYRIAVDWLKDAELDFQLHPDKPSRHKKDRPRRWD